jgi:hypothetical protein
VNDTDEPRPWERSGEVRRDVAPHRAELLCGLANVSLACGLAALVFGVPALVGVPLGLAASVQTSRDLERMATGTLDPQGRAATWAAWRRADTALALNLLAPFVCLLAWCGCLFTLSLSRLI